MNSMCLIKFLCSSSHQLRSHPRMQCLRLFDVSLVTAPWDFKFSEVCLRVHPSLYGLYIGYKSRILFSDVHPSINRVFSVPPYWCLSDPFLKHRQVMSKVVRRVSQWMILHLKWYENCQFHREGQVCFLRSTVTSPHSPSRKGPSGPR